MKTSLQMVAGPLEAAQQDRTAAPVAAAVHEGLTSTPKWLPAWLFYDAIGSDLFEKITELPEYYPTRTERAIFAANADAIIHTAMHAYQQMHRTDGRLRLLELGAGTASKTGILLAAAIRRQGMTGYLPVDVSDAALDEASSSLRRLLGQVDIKPQIANYVTDVLDVPPHNGPTLALYIGSSIGNFAPDEAVAILRNLRAQLRPGDSLLLGTDLVKDESLLVAAYDDSQGVTAAFNLNMLQRINRDLHADFDLSCFQHRARWNGEESRMEMHLESLKPQTVHIPGANITVAFTTGETIHTENSYKFTRESVRSLLSLSGFDAIATLQDEQKWFAVTLASASVGASERRES